VKTLAHLFERNRRWAADVSTARPRFFERLAAQQTPEYLWIGCADSRVPANEIVGLDPGELFVHRNVGNVVVHTDLNCLSVLQYAVDVLKVSHVIVTGHYGCGGVQAALDNRKLGLIDNWLRHIQDVHRQHQSAVDGHDASTRLDRLCELNVIQQARNACETTIVQDAWARGQPLSVHAWIYALRDGLLHDLQFTVTAPAEIEAEYRRAVSGRAGSHALS
jgi:carbonic anhydrase